MPVYQSPFTRPIEITSQKEAHDAYLDFCHYCRKDAIEKIFHCSCRDIKLCEAVKQQILNDWSNEALARKAEKEKDQ